MHISPQRRRRALRVHFLRQQGFSLRRIAQHLDLSHTTVRDDLRLVESHWSTIASAAADDLLLESLQLLNHRLTLAFQNEAVSRNAKRLTPVEYLRAQDAHETRLTHLAREVRRTAAAVQQRAQQRPDQPELYESDDEEPQNPAKHTPKSSTAFHPNSTISSPGLEIVENSAPEEKISENTIHRDQSDPQDAVIEEVLTIFPHLKGRSDREILDFLDQFTNPKEDHAQIQAAAAG